MRYAEHLAQTPQSEPLDATQVPNSAGGFSYAVDDWKRLDRFLILGSEGGSYYATERKLTKENAAAVLRCLEADYPRAVEQIALISESGRAPKNDPAIFALALAASNVPKDKGYRNLAVEAMPRVLRIGTHLFQFVDAVSQFRGWGRSLRTGISGFYGSRDPDALALQVTKYRQRGGWSHRDVLRLCHYHSDNHQPILKWVTKNELVEGAPALLERFVKAQAAKNAADLKPLIEAGLSWEMIPTELLGDPEVWRMLIPSLPMTATLRNLARMTASGALAPMTPEAKMIAERITNQEALRKSRVHPIAVLAAAYTYAAGKGQRGSLTWKPIETINDALDAAFYASFGNVTPSGKRLRVGLDVSGSMSVGEVAGVPGLSPRIASGAMAMLMAKTEPLVEFVAFSTQLVPVDISRTRSLRGLCQSLSTMPFGGTDCALPMVDALKSKVERDAFIVLTDSETWFGGIHPAAALKKYRRIVPHAKLVVVGMVSNGFTIADPNDGGMLDVVGFDLAAPQVMNDFVSERK